MNRGQVRVDQWSSNGDLQLCRLRGRSALARAQVQLSNELGGGLWLVCNLVHWAGARDVVGVAPTVPAGRAVSRECSVGGSRDGGTWEGFGDGKLANPAGCRVLVQVDIVGVSAGARNVARVKNLNCSFGDMPAPSTTPSPASPPGHGSVEGTSARRRKTPRRAQG